MHRAGVYALIAGAILTLVGLVGGFGLLFTGHDEGAKTLLGVIPLGFVIGFAGIVATLLGRPDTNG